MALIKCERCSRQAERNHFCCCTKCKQFICPNCVNDTRSAYLGYVCRRCDSENYPKPTHDQFDDQAFLNGY